MAPLHLLDAAKVFDLQASDLHPPVFTPISGRTRVTYIAGDAIRAVATLLLIVVPVRLRWCTPA
jgi:hypothetical protein